MGNGLLVHYHLPLLLIANFGSEFILTMEWSDTHHKSTSETLLHYGKLKCHIVKKLLMFLYPNCRNVETIQAESDQTKTDPIKLQVQVL